MKVKIPPSVVLPGHRDYDLLLAIKSDLEQRAGGPGALIATLPPLYRREIDTVIKTSITGRRSYGQLEKVERTYIGTLVEMMLRKHLSLPRGQVLDTRLAGVEVDIKHTMGSGWMIPTEAIGHPCILSAADEKTAKSYLGLVVARPEYLRLGSNKDKKTSLKAEAWENILWIYRGVSYPHNFWRQLSDATVDHIFAGKSGNERVRRLFRATIGITVTREAVDDVAQQRDPTRRTRKDNGKGSRDVIEQEGIYILTKERHRELITALGLKVGDYVAVKPTTSAHLTLMREAGFPVDKI